MMRLVRRYGSILLLCIDVALTFASLSMMYEISFFRADVWWYDFPFHLAKWDKWQAYDFWFLMNLIANLLGAIGALLYGRRGRSQK